MVDVPNNPELADHIRGLAGRLGVDPVDLGTVFSYESGGTLDPNVKGPKTKWGQHIGLMQMGETQRREYGITTDSPLPDQFNAFEQYLKDRGVKPGSNLLDLYSAVNAGRVGRYDARDEKAGGAPGTVADKVAGMAPHRVRAELLLNGKLPAGYSPPASAPAPAAPAGASPLSIAPADMPNAQDEHFAGLVDAARKIAAATHEPREMPAAIPQLAALMPSLFKRGSA